MTHAFQRIVDEATVNPFMVYSSQLQSFVTFARHYMSFRLQLKNKSFFMTDGKYCMKRMLNITCYSIRHETFLT